MPRLAFFAAACVLLSAPAFGEQTPSPDGAKAYFIGLEDGATVSSPVTIHFGIKGMGVAPAGVDKANTGHHHLIVDAAFEGEALMEAIPSDENHRHFGGGQTEVTLALPPGKHTLQLVFADMNHVPFAPPVMSAPITITVE